MQNAHSVTFPHLKLAQFGVSVGDTITYYGEQNLRSQWTRLWCVLCLYLQITRNWCSFDAVGKAAESAQISSYSTALGCGVDT